MNNKLDNRFYAYGKCECVSHSQEFPHVQCLKVNY